MILNLSIDYSDVEAIARRYGLDPDKELIIDCSATMKLAKPNFFSVCEIQDFEEINNRSAREYIQEIGKISVAPGIKKLISKKSKSTGAYHFLDNSLSDQTHR